MTVLGKTTGPCLEMGMGLFSTPYLHYACLLASRHLTSYETAPSWAKFFTNYGYETDYHAICVVTNWDAADIERPWDVALVDHDPSERRITDIKRLAHHARYIVVHDADPKFDRVYHYSRIYDLFRWRKVWDMEYRKTVVLSNFVDLADLWQ